MSPTNRVPSTFRAHVAPRLRTALTHLLVVGLMFMGPGTTAALAQATDPSVQDAVSKLAEIERTVDGLEAAQPDAYWTKDDLAFDLAFEEPDTIASWVRDEIAYQAYAGVLRGADGALQAGAANAWDQSLLLASLLYDAGFTARIARASLPDDAATALVNTVRSPAPLAVDQAAALEAYAAAGPGSRADLEQVDARSEALKAELESEALDLSAWLRGTLEDAGVSLGGADMSAVIDDARDYAWVQYRLGPDQPWTSVHPAAPADAEWTSGLEPDTTIDGDIPTELQHRFRFQAVVERRLGGELETNPVMEAWERPVANLNGVPLRYLALPDGYLDDGLSTPRQEAYDDTVFIVPLFNDSLAPGGQFFDLLGSVVPPDAGSSAAGGLFGNLAGGLADATSEVSGEEDAVAMTAHWLEFTLIEPGGQETTYRRMIVDRLGDERRADGDASGPLTPMTDEEILLDLQAQHTFMLAPGRYSAAYLSQRSLSALRDGLDYLETLYVQAADVGAPVDQPSDELSEEMLAAPLLQLFQAFDDASFIADEDVVSYRATPSLVVTTAAYDRSTAQTDIVHNARRTFEIGGGGELVPSFDTALRAGVWESAVEGLVLGGGEEVQDTLSFFAAARSQGVAVRTLTPGSQAAAADLPLPEASVRAIADDLEQGYAVVVPEAMPNETEIAAWWRVDPVLGETLGRGADGRGNAMEYANLVALSFSMFTGMVGFGTCMASGGNVGCCMVDGVTGFMAGFVITSMFASAIAAVGAGLVFDSLALPIGMAGLSWCLLEGQRDGPDAISASRQASAPSCRLPITVAALGERSVDVPSLLTVRAPVSTG
ncbi:MAG: hypothetical protein U5J97_10105 [Trueperaceae bacterium]|nr:hypothetical protein [Trueperaceae bacterium]